jgi:tRNA nucleotidyltransferase (CCA-adding enzyme)
MFTAAQLHLFDILEEESCKHNIPVYVVGGLVRDLLLGYNFAAKDIDFVVEGNSADFAARVAEKTGGEVREFPSFLTAKIVEPALFPDLREIDFASARTEVYPFPGSLPEVSPAGIEADLKRRDFSINAMALPFSVLNEWARSDGKKIGEIQKRLLDYFNGCADLQQKQIKILHNRSFLDDPTRIFRAARYAVRIDGQIEKNTEKFIKGALAADCLETVDNYRKLKEIKKIFLERSFNEIFKVLNGLGVFEKFLLFDPDQRDRVMQALSRLYSLEVSSADNSRFKIGVMIFFLYSSEAGKRFGQLGFSKKKIDSMNQDIKAVRSGGDHKNLNDQALVLAKIISD